MNRRDNMISRTLGLDEIPITGNSALLNNTLMISDNLDNSEVKRALREVTDDTAIHDRLFRIQFSMFLICAGGSISMRLQFKEITLRRGDALIMISGTIGECLDISADANLIMVAFSDEINMIGHGDRVSADLLLNLAAYTAIHLSADELEDVITLYMMLKKRLKDKDYREKEEFTINCMRTIFCRIVHHLDKDDAVKAPPASRGSIIFEKFMRLVDMHASTERHLDFYADRLHITPRYLSKTVLRHSGRTAREWICIRVLLEAKVMLRDRSLTVQQISERLNFPTQSFFGTFFKRHNGVSPVSYRRSIYASHPASD